MVLGLFVLGMMVGLSLFQVNLVLGAIVLLLTSAWAVRKAREGYVWRKGSP